MSKWPTGDRSDVSDEAVAVAMAAGAALLVMSMARTAVALFVLPTAAYSVSPHGNMRPPPLLPPPQFTAFTVRVISNGSVMLTMLNVPNCPHSYQNPSCHVLR